MPYFSPTCFASEANKSVLELKNEISKNQNDIQKLQKTKKRLQGDLYELVIQKTQNTQHQSLMIYFLIFH